MVELDSFCCRNVLASSESRSTFYEKISSHQFEDSKFCVIRNRVQRGESNWATMDSRGILRFVGNVCVSRVVDQV